VIRRLNQSTGRLKKGIFVFQAKRSSGRRGGHELGGTKGAAGGTGIGEERLRHLGD